jgi:hypothetical protein
MLRNKNLKNNLIKKTCIISIILIFIFCSSLPSISSQNISIEKIKFPSICHIKIGDYVWNDLNRDGIQGDQEPGINDVTVELYKCNNQLKDATTTSDGGYYEFRIYPYIDYYIKFILPSDYVFTLQDQGTDDTIDSDADPNTGKTICIDFCYDDDFTWDAGMYEQGASIGDYVWDDLDGDGIQDSCETGVDDVTVELYSCCDTFIDSTLTSCDGFYEFSDINPGNYYVKFILPSGYIFTLQDQGTDDTIDSDADPFTGKTICTNLLSGENDCSWDAGIKSQEFILNITTNTICGWVEKIPDLDTYPSGTVVQLTAHSKISAYEFSHWSGDLSGNNNPEFITMDSNKSVTAHFTLVGFTLTINIDGNGSVIKDPDQNTYHYNKIVELTAVGNLGWNFSHWSGDLSGTNNPEYIKMRGHKTVTAHFTYHEYNLTINIDGNGDVIKNPDQNIFPVESIVELTAVADPGWKFSHWDGNLSGSNNPEYITIDKNKTVTAFFIKANPPDKPIIDGPTVIKANRNYSYTFKATDPEDNYVWFYIDWGDGNTEEWIGPYLSREKIRLIHVWSEKGSYVIKAKARNIYLSESEWGTLEVNMPRNKISYSNLFISVISRFSNIFPLIRMLLY